MQCTQHSAYCKRSSHYLPSKDWEIGLAANGACRSIYSSAALPSFFLFRLLCQIRDHATAASTTVTASSQTVAPRSRSEGGGVTRSCSAVPFCTAVAGGTATVARRKDHSPGSPEAPCHRMCKFVGQCERRNHLPFNLTVTYRGPQPKRGAVVGAARGGSELLQRVRYDYLLR